MFWQDKLESWLDDVSKLVPVPARVFDGEKTEFSVLKGNAAAVACRAMTVWSELLRREVGDVTAI